MLAPAKFFMCFFLMVTIGLLGFGIYLICTQYYKTSRYKPIEARIIDTKIIIHKFHKRGATHKTYEPRIKYVYEVGGKTYVSDNVTTIDPSRDSEKWAERIERNYIAGSTKTAYYNPENPGKAFLLKEFKFDPYALTLGCIVSLFIIFLIYLCIRKIYELPDFPELVSQGQYIIKPYGIHTEYWKIFVFAVFYYIFGILVAGHYFFIFVEPPYKMFPQIYVAAYIFLGLIPLLAMGYDLFQGRMLKEAQVFVNSNIFKRGTKIKLQIDQEVRKDIQVEEASVGLIYAQHVEKKLKKGGEKIDVIDSCQDKEIFLKNTRLLPGEHLKFCGELFMPGRHQSGFSDDVKSFPYYEWYIEVLVNLKDKPDYRAKFSIRVE